MRRERASYHQIGELMDELKALATAFQRRRALEIDNRCVMFGRMLERWDQPFSIAGWVEAEESDG